MVLRLGRGVVFNCSTFTILTMHYDTLQTFFSRQSAASQGFSQEDRTAEAVGVVYWHHPDDLSAMEDCDWSFRQTGPWGAKR